MKVKVYFGKMMYDVIGTGIDTFDYPCLLCIWEKSEESDYLPKSDYLDKYGLENLGFCVSINGTMHGIVGMEIVDEDLVFSAI